METQTPVMATPQPPTVSAGLPSVPELFRDAWKQFNLHFKTFVGLSVVPLVVGIGVGFAFGLSGYLTSDPNQLISPGMIGSFIGVIIVLGLVSLWAAAAMYYFLMISPETTNIFAIYRASAAYLAKLFTTGLLTVVAVFGLSAVVGILLSIGLTAFDSAQTRAGNTNTVSSLLFGILSVIIIMLPIIWLSVKWLFSQTTVIDAGLANRTALQRSSALIRGAWWGIFWRLFAFGAVYLVFNILFSVIISVALRADTSAVSTSKLILDFIQQFINQIIFGSLGYIIIVILYRSRKNALPSA